MSNRDEPVRIWSGEMQGWYRPNAAGYTTSADEAWILPRHEAEAMAAHCGPEKKIQIEVADRRQPMMARCRDEACRHSWPVAYLPMPLDKAARCMQRAICPMCADERPLVGGMGGG